MAIYSGLFNSVAGDRKYNAWWFAMYFSTFIGNGVFPNPSNGLQVMDNVGLKTEVKAGKGWINGYFIYNDSNHILQHDPANGLLSRIDKVVLRLDYLSRDIKIVIKKGVDASSPVAPGLQRDDDIYELGLADVRIGTAITEILQGNITDLRLNKSMCGIVTGTVDQVDTTSIFNQYQSWFNNYSVVKAKEFADWEIATKNNILQWVASEQESFQAWRQSEEALYQTWLSGKRKEFDDWFLLVKGTLSTDAAGNLFNMIHDHMNASMPHKYLDTSDGKMYKYGLQRNPTLNCVAFIYEEDI